MNDLLNILAAVAGTLIGVLLASLLGAAVIVIYAVFVLCRDYIFTRNGGR